MNFTITFLKIFFSMVVYLGPVLLFFFAMIAVLGQIVGRIEKWSVLNSQYFAFITASTVGYGDLHPKKRLSKFLSLFIALMGLISTGILVTVAVKAADITFDHHYDREKIERVMKKQIIP